MITSCEDITTLDQFEEFMNFRANILRLGLEETANMLCWHDTGHLMCPELFNVLLDEDTFNND